MSHAPLGAPLGGEWRLAASRLLSLASRIVRTRLELASVELAQERQRFVRTMVSLGVTLFLLFLGVSIGVAWIVWLTPVEQMGWVLGGLSALFLTLSAVSAWVCRRLGDNATPALSATLDELARDEEFALERANGS